MMELAIVILINISVILFFFLRMKKYFSKIELFVYLLFSTIPIQNAAALEIDFSLILPPKVQTIQWAYTLNRLILNPIVIVWFLNHFSGCKTKSSKAFAWIISLFLLVGIEFTSISFGLYKINYGLWWVISRWLLILALSFLFMRFFQSKLRKQGIRKEY